jgi:hypothetical protein
MPRWSTLDKRAGQRLSIFAKFKEEHIDYISDNPEATRLDRFH